MPKVSVCCSVKNQLALFKDMVKSVIDQTYKDWELIVVDDGSEEDVKFVCEFFKDERIKYVRFDINKGIPVGVNCAFKMAKGEYVQPLAADEFLSPDKLDFQVKYLDEHPEVDCIWGLPQNGPMGERPMWEQSALKAHNRSREQWISTLLNRDNTPIGGASALWRKAVFDSIGYFEPSLGQCSDMEWFIRFFEKHEGRILPYRWAACKDNPDQTFKCTVNNTIRFLNELEYIKQKHPIPNLESGKITIGIPVKDMEKWVGEAIQSILDQTFQDFEIMVLDDNSSDKTLEVVNSFKDPRIKVFHFDAEESKGVKHACNYMLQNCNTPLFGLLAADDTIDKTLLQRCKEVLDGNSLLEFVATQTDFMEADGKPSPNNIFTQIEKASNKAQQAWKDRLYWGNVYFGVGIYRTKTLKDLGGWDNSVGVLGDYDMYLKLLQRGNVWIIEENLTHTRIHDNNRSIIKTHPGRVELSEHYYTIKSRYYQPRIKLIIATPFYEMKGYSPYIMALSQTIKLLGVLGIEHEWWEVSGDSYVERAKNTIVNRFLENPENTDLFMIDADMQWNPEAFVKMLMLPEEVVIGSYPQKNSWSMWTSAPKLVEEDGVRRPQGKILSDGSAIILGEALSGGFMRIKRAALLKYKEAYKDYTYQDGSADPGAPDRVYTEFFACERKDGLRWGEDRVFSNRLKAIGQDFWIYPNVNFCHYGVKGWSGNFHEWLIGQRPPQDGIVEKVK